MASSEFILIKCGHCGNIGNCKILTKYSESLDDEYFYDIHTWHILKCPACGRWILKEDWEHDFSGIMRDEAFSTKILYPVDTKVENIEALPTSVKTAYEAALNVQKIEPNAFAVLIGRTLEVICKYEKASGKVLAEKIEDLALSGRIPRTLADMASQLRQLRNLAAHADEDEVTEADVPIIRDFVDAIIEYLYIAPAKVAKLKTRLRGKSVDLIPLRE